MVYHPPIQIVDSQDKPLRGGGMDEAHKQGLIHRIVYIFVEDGQGRVLLQKRSPEVVVYQDCWDVSASGHVDFNEAYEVAAERELREEIGISGYALTEIDYYYDDVRVDWRQLKRFCKVFRVEVPADTQFVVEPTEVSEVQWMTTQEIAELIEKHPEQVAGGLVACFDRYYKP